MPAPKDDQTTIPDKDVAYRKRLAAMGGRQMVISVPAEMVAFLDELKARQGLRNRSQAVVQLIEQGRRATQQSA